MSHSALSARDGGCFPGGSESVESVWRTDRITATFSSKFTDFFLYSSLLLCAMFLLLWSKEEFIMLNITAVKQTKSCFTLIFCLSQTNGEKENTHTPLERERDANTLLVLWLKVH